MIVLPIQPMRARAVATLPKGPGSCQAPQPRTTPTARDGHCPRRSDSVAGKNYRFSDYGTHDLKGFEERARLFEVGWV